ncbi:hypothetical protein NQ317_000598 [Molorchus minor]|uniref:LITAF domain-containing protein n=1 Tax=Molorchus minor TaxID=1323400 RepID=A0ABQ9J0Z8_9CUCU|nr:hypothetical protein NQ317_000598 [Molorchus minor]
MTLVNVKKLHFLTLLPSRYSSSVPSGGPSHATSVITEPIPIMYYSGQQQYILGPYNVHLLCPVCHLYIVTVVESVPTLMAHLTALMCCLM